MHTYVYRDSVVLSQHRGRGSITVRRHGSETFIASADINVGIWYALHFTVDRNGDRAAV